MKLRRVLFISTALSSAFLLTGVTAPLAQPYDWSGFYAGVGIAGSGTNPASTLDLFVDEEYLEDLTDQDSWFGGNGDINESFDEFPGAMSGFGVEFDAGFNAQFDSFLLGVEASIMVGPLGAEAGTSLTNTVTFETSSVSAVSTLTTSATSTFTTSYATQGFDTYFTLTENATQTVATSITSGDTTFVTSTTTTFDGTTTSSTFLTTSSTSSLTYAGDTTYLEFESNTTTEFQSTAIATATVTGRASIDWLATIKGRAGFVADRTLFFVSGGLAVGGVTQEVTAEFSIPEPGGTATGSFTETQTETKVGVVVSAGVEHAVTNNWILSGEVEYFNLGTAEFDFGDMPDYEGLATQALDGFSIKGGIKYKF